MRRIHRFHLFGQDREKLAAGRRQSCLKLGQPLRTSYVTGLQRAQQIHEGFLDYLEKVSGPGAANVHKALSDLLILVRTPVNVPQDFVSGMLREMRLIFRRKPLTSARPI